MFSILRRRWMAQTLTAATLSPLAVHTELLSASESREHSRVRPRPLQFPQDHGAHLSYRTEWWYITGWLGQGDAVIGFQVTFFRSRTRHSDENPSRFAPRQLMFAHVALAVPSIGRLLHADRAARVGPGLMSVSDQDTDVRMGDWRLQRQQQPQPQRQPQLQSKGDRYLAQVMTADFGLAFEASTNHPPVLRGNGGYSAKGPLPSLASFYYSRPHLDVQATVRVAGKEQSMRGLAWLDHEWSSSLLMPQAVGWDWIGINLLNGTSLMAFRIRDAQGKTLWQHVDWRDVNGRIINQSDNQGVWQPSQQWRSPRSQIQYTVGFDLRFNDQNYNVLPLMLDQEVDARASTGGFYWEGAVSLVRNGVPIGRGYLELTGYGDRLIL